MKQQLSVHPRVIERHPELTESDIVIAWENALSSAPRLEKNPNEYVAVGFDSKGRLIEMVAIRESSGDWMLYHAKTPPTKKTLAELRRTMR